MKMTKFLSTMCAVLIALVMSACGETSQSSTESKAEAETTTTTAPAADTESETTTTTVVNDESEAETTTTTPKVEAEKIALKTGFNESTNIKAKNGGLIYHIPSYFQKEETSESSIIYYHKEDDGSTVKLLFNYLPYYDNMNISDKDAKKLFDILKENMKIDDSFSSTEIEQTSTFLSRTAYGITFTKNDTTKNVTSICYMFLIDNSEKNTMNYGIITFVILNDNKYDYDYATDAKSILSTIEIDKEYVYDKPADTQKDDNSKSEEKKKSEETYENNSYYDVVETASWTDMLGSTHIIHKVQAKQDVSISATMLAYSESGSVIGKGSSDIVLTKGQTNYFSYYFDEDVSNAQFKPSFKTKDNSYMLGERNGVELVEYSITGDNLYLTLKQTIDELGAFAKFKILLYNGDQIVGTEEGFYSISAENLDGKGSTDVAEIWTYGTAYDRIEFIYEP